MSKQITTIARLKAKPGAEVRLEELLKSLIEPTRAESGCIDYTMHRDLEEPGAYYFYDNCALDRRIWMHILKRRT